MFAQGPPVARTVAEPAAGSPALVARLELYFSARALPRLDLLSKSDPFLVVSLREGGRGAWREIWRSPTIKDCHNPSWTTPCTLPYKFEVLQELRIDVFDEDSPGVSDLRAHDYVGSASMTVGKVVGSRGSKWSGPLVGSAGMPAVSGARGELTVRAEEVAGSTDVCHMQLAARGLDRLNFFGLGSSDPFVQISRLGLDGGWVRIWQSEYLTRNLSPVWKPCTIPVQQLCNGEWDRALLVQVMDWESSGSHRLIGQCQTSLRELTANNAGQTWLLKHPDKADKKKGYSGSGMLSVCPPGVRVERVPTLLDFVRGGCQLNMVVAIDCTASNGQPTERASLHYRGGQAHGQLNEYQRAILSIGTILQDYDTDQRFPVFGFGGSIGGRTEHCFPLTFDPGNVEVEGVAGIMNAYNLMLDVVQLSGPTYFAPVIRATSERARCSQNEQTYTTLLIITDGAITDLDATIHAIVEGSALPLSIIIVGVGSADFGSMVELDGDERPLVDRHGKRMRRDIVQFVEFRKHAGDEAKMAEAVLAEMPGQLVEFMRLTGIRPKPPTLASQRAAANIEVSQRNVLGGVAGGGGAQSAGVAMPMATAVAMPLPPDTQAQVPPATAYAAPNKF